MRDFEPFEEDPSGTVFRDVVMLALVGFVALVIMLLPHLNPPGAKTADGMAPPGNLIVEVRWPDEIDADVDLWVQAPGDVPVGYSNKGGALFNLLRDDLGNRIDVTGLNYETSYSRGIKAVHGQPAPLPQSVGHLSDPGHGGHQRETRGQRYRPAAAGERRRGNDRLSFDLTEDGDLVAGSVHSLQKPLRAWSGR